MSTPPNLTTTHHCYNREQYFGEACNYNCRLDLCTSTSHNNH